MVTYADVEEGVLGAYNQLPLISESLTEAVEHTTNETLNGGAGEADSDIIAHMVAGDAQFSGRYDGMDPFIACALGFEKQPQAAGELSPEFLNDTISTIAGSGQTTSNVKDSATSFTSADVGKWIRIDSGSGEGQVRRISAYVGTDEVTVTPDWDVIPASGDAWAMSDEFQHQYECTNLLQQILWTAADDDASSFTYATGGVGTSGDNLLRRLTLGIDKQTSIWVFRAVMVNSITLSWQAQQGLILDTNLVAFDVTRSSSANTSSSGWDWSPSGKMESLNQRIIFHHGTFRIKDYDSGGLASGDKLGIKSFNLTINNNLIADDQDTVSGIRNKEPARNGLREVSGSFELARYNTDTFHTDLGADTIKMADMKFTGESMGNNNKALNIYLPRFKITNSPSPVPGKQVLDQTVEFKCLNGTEDITGFPAATITSPYSPVLIETINRCPFNQFLDQNQEY